MPKNNVLALVVHLVISVFAFLALKNLMDPKKMGLAIAVGLLISLVYVFTGYYFINRKKGYTSVLSALAVGLMIWGFCYTNTEYVEGHFDGLLFIVYYIYTFPFILLTLPIQKFLTTMAYGRQTIDIINIYLTLIPSGLFCLGIFLKRRKLKLEDSMDYSKFHLKSGK